MNRWLARLASAVSLGALAVPALASVEPAGVVPLGNPGQWVTTDDYPPAALRAGEQGTVGFQLMVDAEGAVTQCTISQSSNFPDLDAATCALITHRAHFSPASDANGRPAAGLYRSRIKWLIPRTNAPAPADQTMARRMIVEADGSISHCENASSTAPNAQFTPETCPALNFEPYRSASGAPLRKRVTSTVTITVEDVPK